jgi:hypothetical protein
MEAAVWRTSVGADRSSTWNSIATLLWLPATATSVAAVALAQVGDPAAPHYGELVPLHRRLRS